MDDASQLKPNQQEVKLVQQSIEDQYGTTLPRADATRFAALARQLAQWSDETVAMEGMADEFRELVTTLRKEVPARKEVQKLREVLAQGERLRIVHNMRGIVIAHRPVPYNPETGEDLFRLVQSRYGVTLDADQLAQAVAYLTRALWQSEGLGASLAQAIRAIESGGSEKSSGYFPEALSDLIRRIQTNKAGTQSAN